MATFFIPTEERQITQPNNGLGLLSGSYNMDFTTSRGTLAASGNVLKVIDENDDTDFNSYAAKIVRFKDKWYAIGDDVFRTTDTPDDPTGTWAQLAGAPSVGNTVTDAVVFDSLLLVVEGDDIQSFDGSNWASWWKTTLGQSALNTGQRFFLRIGSNRKLFITDGGNKLYSVTTGGIVDTAGEGTLDFSATTHTFTCMETSSSRLWIGTANSEGEAHILEWDMGPLSDSPNREHKVGANAVRCIAIWNDIPIAILSNGQVKYFNGEAFVNFEGVQFPNVETDLILNEDFMHPNGWAIIDGLPHFLVTGKIETGEDENVEATKSLWNMPSGVWCLDPQVGLYHRFAAGSGKATQSDYGQYSIKEMGALYALDNPDSKFLASYEYLEDNSTSKATLVYHDTSHTKPSKSFFVSSFMQSLGDTWKKVKLLHRTLTSGDEIKLYYRIVDEDTVRLTGTWADTTHFHTTDSATGVEVGDHVFVKNGSGAGQILRVEDIDTSSSTTVLTTEENTLASAEDTGTIDVLNFRRFATITDASHVHDFDIPTTDTTHRLQILCSLHRGAENRNEVNYCIINT